MKLCVSSYSLARWRREQGKSLEDSIVKVKELGVSAIEFSGIGDSKYAAKAKNPIDLAKRVRDFTEKQGLAIAGYSVGGDLILPPAKQKEAIEQRKLEIDVAAALGVRSTRQDVTRGFPKDWKGKGPQTFAEALKIVVPPLRELADYAQERGVILTLENHGFYMQESKRVEKLIKTVNHANYALTLDMGNFLCVNEDPVQAVARVAKYAVIAHTKDFHVRPKKMMPPSGWFATPTPIALRGAIVGHGEIDIPAELKLLKKAKYKGYLSLEFEGMEEPIKAVTLGLEYLKLQLQALNAYDG